MDERSSPLLRAGVKFSWQGEPPSARCITAADRHGPLNVVAVEECGEPGYLVAVFDRDRIAPPVDIRIDVKRKPEVHTFPLIAKVSDR